MDCAFHIGWYSMNLLWYKLLQKDFLQSPTCVEKNVYIIYRYTDKHPLLPLFQIKCTMVSYIYIPHATWKAGSKCVLQQTCQLHLL